MSWNLRYEGGAPPLPPPLETRASEGLREAWFGGTRARVRTGCWVVTLTPKYAEDAEDYGFDVFYSGTLRLVVESEGHEARGSGDLYLGDPDRRFVAEIPVFPRDDYRYYLRLVELEPISRSELSMAFELHRFSPRESGWTDDGRLRAKLRRRGRSRRFPRLCGDLVNETGTVVAEIELEYVSQHLRRAAVQVDRVKRVERLPLSVVQTTDAGPRTVTLESVFAEVGWELEVDSAGRPTVDPPGDAFYWTNEALHEHMLLWRGGDGGLVDERWLYHLLCVEAIQTELYGGFGRMYDTFGVDSNHIPREGVVVAYSAFIPPDESYGDVAGRALGDVPEIYFHTAVHELGHAMGLSHNFSGRGFMHGIRALAELAVEQDRAFPAELGLFFDPEDAQRLRHLPDPWVRPGGVPFQAKYSYEPIPVEDLTREPEDLELRVEPLQNVLPLGAPLRIALELVNVGSEPVYVPPQIGLGSGVLAGSVSREGGTRRHFSAAVRFVRWHRSWGLEPTESLIRSETLLRGREGALLPGPGAYRVEAAIVWEGSSRGRSRVRGAADVLITDAVDAQHARAALATITTPDLLQLLVFRWAGRTLPDGAIGSDLAAALEALQEALECPTLRPHYAVIEARRLLEISDLRVEAARWLTADALMTGSEVASVSRRFGSLKPVEAQLLVVREALASLAQSTDQVPMAKQEREDVRGWLDSLSVRRRRQT